MPPAKFVHDEENRRGSARSSLVSGGCIVSGTEIRNSLLFTQVHTNSYASLDHAVVLPYVEIERSAQLRNVVIDAGVHHPRRGWSWARTGRRIRAVVPRSPSQGGITLVTQRPMLDSPGDGALIGMKKVLSVASECAPVVKTGGLADVVGALPGALAPAGDGRCAPCCRPIRPSEGRRFEARKAWNSTTCSVAGAHPALGRPRELDLFLLDAPHLFDPPGGPYGDPSGTRTSPDNAAALRRPRAARRRDAGSRRLDDVAVPARGARP